MNSIFIMLVPLVFIILISFVAVPLVSMFRKTFSTTDTSSKKSIDAKYSRQVHHMHIKDAAGERRHRLDQLKSLYDAGMMERDEYEERVAAVEEDYRGRM